MNILITGASGFVGGNLTKKLAEDPANKIRILVRKNSNLSYLKSLNLEKAYGDLLDMDSLNKACKNIDIVFHCAALFSSGHIDKEKFHSINVEGTKNVCRAALNNKVKRLIYTSSAATTGYPGKEKTADETTVFNKWKISNEYTRSKFLAEQAVLDYVKNKNLKAVILNPVAPLGPGDIKPTPTGKFIQKYLAGKIPFYVESIAHYVHIDDVVDGHIKAMTKGKIGQRYILGSNNLMKSEILKILEKVSGVSSKKIIRLPYFAVYLGAIGFKMLSFILRKRIGPSLATVKYMKKSSNYNFSKAINELGITQTPIEKAFADAVNWFKHEHLYSN